MSVLIVDFGSQTTQLIARRIREFEVFCEVINPEILTKDYITKYSPSAIILSGGPSSVYENDAPLIDKKLFDFGIPILGICYGQQLICHLLRGRVAKSSFREFGDAKIEIVKDSKLFHSIKNKQVWMSHGDSVKVLPDGFDIIAKTNNTRFAAIGNETKNIWGLQFHPEVSHTIDGGLILNNFITKIAKVKKNWNVKNLYKEGVEKTKALVGNSKVICGLSGGVDSSVAAVLINKSIGKQLTCIFVNNGLMRKNEDKEVVKIFNKNFKINLINVDASKTFLSRLKGVTNPEKKRKIIGKTFVEVFDKEASKISGVEFLAQGTLYPDVIESSHPNGGISHVIKSHHNVGGLPKNMKLKLLEPLRMLFKDEVRKLGKELKIPDCIVNRHPFPGPGLAIRIIGEVTKRKIKILQEVDFIYINELKKANLYNKIWQAYAALLPIKTVGVMGDSKTYEYMVLLRAVTSVDGMTAESFNFDPKFLSYLSNKIVNEVKGVNRVVYDSTSKPPATIELE